MKWSWECWGRTCTDCVHGNPRGVPSILVKEIGSGYSSPNSDFFHHELIIPHDCESQIKSQEDREETPRVLSVTHSETGAIWCLPAEVIPYIVPKANPQTQNWVGQSQLIALKSVINSVNRVTVIWYRSSPETWSTCFETWCWIRKLTEWAGDERARKIWMKISFALAKYTWAHYLCILSFKTDIGCCHYNTQSKNLFYKVCVPLNILCKYRMTSLPYYASPLTLKIIKHVYCLSS